MSRIVSYLKAGAIAGGLIGSAYGVYHGLQCTDNGFWEALHNMTSKSPNIFTTEYWVMLKDTVIGITGGAALGGLAGLVDNMVLCIKEKAQYISSNAEKSKGEYK